MKHDIKFADDRKSFACDSGQHLLAGMVQSGSKSIPVGCRSGGCGVCKVEIVTGRYTTVKMSRAHVSVDEQVAGISLACRTFPESDLSLRVLGKIKNITLGDV